MIYKLYPSTVEYLLKQPETGMGYQVILGRMSGNHSTERYVVYNSDLILNLDSAFSGARAQILSEGYSAILRKANYINIEITRIFNFNDIKEIKILAESKKTKNQRKFGGTGATDNPPKYANGEDIFVRLSAYEDDKRIDTINKCLKPGSFTTTFRDYITCFTTDDDPIDRYALPNDEKISWAFYIKPKKGNEYQEGIVQPAFGHDGGGIEDYFKNGTSPNTYALKLPYGNFDI